MPKFAIFDTCFEFVARRLEVYLSFVENIIQMLKTNDQEICFDTTYGLSREKICQILTNAVFFAYFFDLFMHVLS